MDLSKITSGRNPPKDVHALIEISFGGVPVKYEMDKASSTLFVDRFSVEFIEKWISKEFGPAVSTAQTPDQVGKNRPPVYAPLRGLYFAGCNAGARGVGTELAAASAMECVDRVLLDVGRDVPGRRTRSTNVAFAMLAR